jgi:hypothetical protein
VFSNAALAEMVWLTIANSPSSDDRGAGALKTERIRGKTTWIEAGDPPQ